MLRHPDGATRAARHRRAGRPRRRHEAAGGRGPAGRGRAVRRGRLRRPPGAGQGLHRAGVRSATARRRGIRFLVDPRVVTGTRVGDRRRLARPATCSGSSPVVTSRPTASSTSPTSSRRRVPELRLSRSRSPAASRSATSSSSAASTPRRSGSPCSTADGKPVVVTMGSYGIGVTRAVAAIAETTCDEFGLCWPREVAPADVHVVIAGKPGGEQWPAAEHLADRARGRRRARAARRPRLGLAGRQVQGRRADRRPDDRRRRPRHRRR